MSLDNPMPGGQIPPARPHQAPYPVYPPYHAYPGYSPYPYYGYAQAPQVPVPVLPPVPSRAPDKPGRQRLTNVVVTVVLAALTVGALALAATAPAFVVHDPGAPSGYTQVYNAPLHEDPNAWDVTSGCDFAQGGLHAVSASTPTLCLFTPSKSTDYVSNGFYLTTQVAPPGAVANQEAACILLDSSSGSVSFAIDQNGAYAVNTDSQYICSTTPGSGQSPRATAAWHGDGSVPNTVSLAYDATNNLLSVYLNGQQIAQLSADLSSQYSISLGTPPTGNDAGGGTTYEVVFTSFGLWSAASS